MRWIPIFLMLMACEKAGVQVEPIGAVADFNVARLFIIDGCTVYRFSDAGGWRYFASCQGATNWNEHQGKQTIHKEIPTYKE